MIDNRYQIFRTDDCTDKTFLKGMALMDELDVWSEFMLHDAVGNKYFERIFEEFTPYQFFVFDGDHLVGYGNSVPLSLDGDTSDNLPDKGWDWALSKAFADKENGLIPNALSALQIGINPAYRGMGISSILIDEMKNIATDSGFANFILPVRPNLKHKYPLIDINDYLTWKTDNGLPYDPWIRAHAKNGAEVIKVCRESMYISGTIAEWEDWTGCDMKTSGQYVIEGALIPIAASVEDNLAEYIEPNVWMRYRL